MEVMSPSSKNLQTYGINRLLVYVYREFSAAAKRGLLPCIGVEELFAQFPNVSEAIIRKKMKDCAFLRVILHLYLLLVFVTCVIFQLLEFVFVI